MNTDHIASRVHQVRDSLPQSGLFAGHTWRIAPEPLLLPQSHVEELESLGRMLWQFLKAVNLLDRRSGEGKLPHWIRRVLRQGKSSDLLGIQDRPVWKNALPRVLRPDLLLTDSGWVLSELDSVPGGIGLTHWQNQTYAALGDAVLGGANGMRDGFVGIFGDAPKVHVVVSEESEGYRPEMEWLMSQIGGERFQVRDGSPFTPDPGDAVYRFFELFDLDQVPCAATLLQLASEGTIQMTAPPRTLFEEKMLFALLWNRNLRSFWTQELGARFFDRLLERVPYTWLMDPSPLPPHAAYPRLELTDWQQLKTLSQRERNLILKISGYSPLGWGARGVFLGSDLSVADWSGAVDRAIGSWPTNPFILQEYRKPRLIPAVYHDFQNDRTVRYEGRLRLCPYYFVSGHGDEARPRLAGALATICPADKKIIHGMTDAVLAPVQIAADPQETRVGIGLE